MESRVEATKKIRGTIVPPPDKSITHRAIFFASIASGTCKIYNPLISDDTKRTMNVIKSLGAVIDKNDKEIIVKPSEFSEPSVPLYCGNSGTTARISLGLIARNPIFVVLYGDNSLSKRPMDRIVEPLKALGAELNGRNSSSNLPMTVMGGNLHSAKYTSKIASAQVKTSFIIAALAANDVSLYTEPLKSRDHTERFLKQFEAVEVSDNAVMVKPSNIPAFSTNVVGDFSSASFFLTLGACHSNARIEIENVGLNPTRTKFLEVLKRMGAKIEIVNFHQDVEPYGTIVVESSKLHGIDVDAEEIPSMIDEIPLVALAGVFADGKTIVHGASEIRKKESDRIKSTVRILSKMGANIEEYEDGFAVEGGHSLHDAVVETFGDHRMAMFASIAGICSQGANIKEAESVSISYPSFYSDLERIVAR